jgi:hypothetical protein
MTELEASRTQVTISYIGIVGRTEVTGTITHSSNRYLTEEYILPQTMNDNN